MGLDRLLDECRELAKPGAAAVFQHTCANLATELATARKDTAGEEAALDLAEVAFSMEAHMALARMHTDAAEGWTHALKNIVDEMVRRGA